MKKFLSPAILSRDFINEKGYFTRNISIKPVLFQDTDDQGNIKEYPSFAMSITKLSGSSENRSVVQKAFIDKDGKPDARPDSTTLYLPPDVIEALKDDLQDIDFSKVQFKTV